MTPRSADLKQKRNVSLSGTRSRADSRLRKSVKASDIHVPDAQKSPQFHAREQSYRGGDRLRFCAFPHFPAGLSPARNLHCARNFRRRRVCHDAALHLRAAAPPLRRECVELSTTHFCLLEVLRQRTAAWDVICVGSARRDTLARQRSAICLRSAVRPSILRCLRLLRGTAGFSGAVPEGFLRFQIASSRDFCASASL